MSTTATWFSSIVIFPGRRRKFSEIFRSFGNQREYQRNTDWRLCCYGGTLGCWNGVYRNSREEGNNRPENKNLEQNKTRKWGKLLEKTHFPSTKSYKTFYTKIKLKLRLTKSNYSTGLRSLLAPTISSFLFPKQFSYFLPWRFHFA